MMGRVGCDRGRKKQGGEDGKERRKGERKEGRKKPRT
jgi:hypothetical protein